MPERASIALACAIPGERASVTEWLSESGYDPVAIPDLARLDDSLRVRAIEALIADMTLVPREDDLWALVRRLGTNRPLVVLGDSSQVPKAMFSDLTVVPRPITRESVLLSVALALAEGRPARRYSRRYVEPIPASAHGLPATIRETSERGVGLELSGPRPVLLPPYFSLRVPDFGVHVVVKRAWTAPVGPDLTRCGGTVEGDLPDAARPWAEFAREAPAPAAPISRRGGTGARF